MACVGQHHFAPHLQAILQDDPLSSALLLTCTWHSLGLTGAPRTPGRRNKDGWGFQLFVLLLGNYSFPSPIISCRSWRRQPLPSAKAHPKCVMVVQIQRRQAWVTAAQQVTVCTRATGTYPSVNWDPPESDTVSFWLGYLHQKLIWASAAVHLFREDADSVTVAEPAVASELCHPGRQPQAPVPSQIPIT